MKPKLERFQKRKITLNRTSVIKITKLSILVVFAFFLSKSLKESSFFKIGNIFVHSDREFQEDPLKKMGQETFFSLDAERIHKYLLKSYPEIEKIEVKKTFPNSLSLYLTYRTPLATATESFLEISETDNESTESAKINFNFIRKDDPKFLIDKNAVLFKKSTEDENLPLIGVNLQNKNVGDRIEDNTALSMLQILQNLKDANDNPSWIVSQDSKIVFKMADGELVIASQNPDIEKLISSLQLIRNRFRIEGRKLEYIDLRFEKPVVKFLKE